MSTKRITRRNFLRTTAMVGTGAALAACGTAAAPQAPAATTAPEAPAATAAPEAAAPALDLPFEVEDIARDPFNLDANVEVEGVHFKGGFGDDYIKYAGEILMQLYPGLKYKHEGIQKIADQLRPRLVAGNPPDVTDNSGAGSFPTIDLISENQLYPLDELMEAPALDTPGVKFKDTLFPGSQDSGFINGKQYFLNVAYTVNGIWYSQPWFEKAGYTYPETWDDFLALCETIKTEGKMAPWTYQGKYPYYMWGIVAFPLLQHSAGTAQMIAIDNLEPNAWKTPEVKRAIEAMYALYDKGYIMQGTAGLTHTESQAEWLNGKAAFLPCGSWLENEMKTVTPEGFNMIVNRIPGFADGKGDQKAVFANGGEPFVVWAKGKNPKHGLEFMRCQLSRSAARYFAENVSSLMPVKDATEGAKISTGTASAIALADSSGGANVVYKITDWYSKFTTELENLTGELLTGKIKPDGFIESVQKAADAVAADPDIPKFKREK
jgi:N-acetylglucosamine transport system substrate-binding protein